MRISITPSEVLDVAPVTFVTISDQETIRLGRRLGGVLSKGDVVGLAGELGSGKTWFAKGLALGLGISSNMVVTSPSFTLVNEYEGECPFYHMDLYRLDSLSDVQSIGLEEYLNDESIAAIEWADRWPEILPEGTVTVKLAIIDDHRREITFSGQHPRALEIIRRFEQDKD
jgi:tRNA threonylcarbamoyladenosine biosynthesis protein TsaE